MMESEFLRDCQENNLDGVNDCLSRGVDVNTTKSNKWSGLMFACERGHSAIVSRLVQVPGLDINYQDVIMASYHGQTKCARKLAETGRVDWNKRDREGETPLYLVLDRRHSDIMDIIVQQKHIDYGKTNHRMTADDEKKSENEANAPAEKTSSLGEVKIGLSPMASLNLQKFNLIACGILACLSYSLMFYGFNHNDEMWRWLAAIIFLPMFLVMTVNWICVLYSIHAFTCTSLRSI